MCWSGTIRDAKTMLRDISFVLPVNASNALVFNIYYCFFYLFIPRSQGVIPCVEGFIFAV